MFNDKSILIAGDTGLFAKQCLRTLLDMQECYKLITETFWLHV